MQFQIIITCTHIHILNVWAGVKMVLPNHSSIYKITSGCASKTATVAFENRHKIYASQEMDSFALNSDFNFDWKCPILDNYFLYNNPIPEHVRTCGNESTYFSSAFIHPATFGLERKAHIHVNSRESWWITGSSHKQQFPYF